MDVPVANRGETPTTPLLIDSSDGCDYSKTILMILLILGVCFSLVPQFYEQGGTSFPSTETGCFRVGPAVCTSMSNFVAVELQLRRQVARGRERRRVNLQVKGFMSGDVVRVFEFPEGSILSKPVRLFSTMTTRSGSYTGVVCAPDGEFVSVSSKWTIGSNGISGVLLFLRVISFIGFTIGILVTLCLAKEHSETKVSVLVASALILTLRGRGSSSHWLVIVLFDLLANIISTLSMRFAHLFLLGLTVHPGLSRRRLFNAGFLGSGAIACIGWFLAFASRFSADSVTFYVSAIGIVSVADIFWAILVKAHASSRPDESLLHRRSSYEHLFLILAITDASVRAYEAWFAPPRLMLIFECISCCAEIIHAAFLLIWHIPVASHRYEPVIAAGGSLIETSEEDEEEDFLQGDD